MGNIDWRKMRRIAVIVIGIILLAALVSAEEHIEQVRPDDVDGNYLSNEDLAYLTCADQSNLDVRSSLFCLDDSTLVNLDTIPWADNCYLTTYDLEGIDCQNLQLQAEFIENNANVKVTDRVKIRRVNSLVAQLSDGQNEDGSWGDPISTAYAIFAYSKLDDTFSDEVNSGLTWLKDNRDNDEKCWPEDDCNIKTTATVSAMLRLANKNTSLRVVHDAELWLLSQQNVLTGNEAWKINVTPQPHQYNNSPFLPLEH